LSTALVASALVTACSTRLPYAPAELEEQAAPTEFLGRAVHDRTLADLVRASGYDEQWPPEQWRLDTLTLVGLYFNPEMDVSRAQAVAARAALTTASRRSPLSVQLAAEHHSREVDDSPWSLGIAVGLPIGTQSRREARLMKASLLADAAEIEIAASAWRVRGAVRDAIIDLSASNQRARLIEERLLLHDELLQLLQRRVDAGMLSARDLGRERMARATAEADLSLERTRQANALGALAGALGLPLETVRSLRIADNAIEDPTAIPDAAVARGEALRNRLDIHVHLLEYGAADAEVRLAVAEQYPTVTLSPGFMWDQGDNVWSLASALVVPPSAQAVVREAEARRDLAARQFTALQIRTINEVERAREVLQVTQASINAGADIASQAQAQLDRASRYFESGGGDRVSLVTARLAAQQARQHLLDAKIVWRKSVARFEDAVQLPMLGDFLNLPDQRTASGAST
jgi:outer membrane protein TolC